MKKMNVVVAFDSKYMVYAKSMIVSLIKNNVYEIDIYLLYSRLTNDELDEVKEFIKKFSEMVNLIPIYIDKSQYMEFEKIDRFSEEAYFRLLIQSILPKDIDRALWLDSDLIIRKSLKDFYYQNFEDNFAAACQDICMFVNSQGEHLERLELPVDTKYFNSGVLLLNLEKIRKEIDQEEYFKCIRKFKNRLQFPDQDVLNVIFKGKIKYNDDQYGSYNRCVGFLAKYNAKEKKELKANVKILHYLGIDNKPTNAVFNNFLFDEYWKYGKYAFGIKNCIKYTIKNRIYRLKEMLKKK